jgi:hypothetical protein
MTSILTGAAGPTSPKVPGEDESLSRQGCISLYHDEQDR